MHLNSDSPSDQHTFDTVVVGAGNAALCAALSARERGMRVLVLERGPHGKRGGNSYFTDGAIRFAYNDLNDIRDVIPRISDEEAEQIVMPSYSEADYLGDLMRVTGNQSDPELARQIVTQSPSTIRWMRDHGVKFDLIYDNQSFLKDGKYHFWGGLPVKTDGKGVGLIERLNVRAEELGIEVWYESRATRLLTDKGRVTGVLVQRGEQEITLQAGSVVLACGSFEASRELRAEHIGQEWDAAIVRGTEFNTGDGISMALAVGAQRYGDWSGCHAIGTDAGAPKVGDFGKPGDIYKKHSYPLGLLINKSGLRFVDEGADFRNYTYAKYGREILKQPGHVAYQIFDSQVRPMLRKEYNLEEATFYQADTLEELASLLDVDQKQFLETIGTYNAAVQDGDYNPTVKDGKGTVGITPPKSNWALAVEQGPFYAFPVTCGITFAFGGVRVSPQGEVLNADQEAIPGLFAAGEMVGGIFYQNYPGGSGLMSGAVFGKLAGESSAQYVQASSLALTS
ncbi:FAD-dependent tricarballylate dehydrogenase TcuA [Deinococcus deserti]|uniref:Putative FAD binding protein, putative fumarate reductase flavoprotein subunit n=1 Tax=Deinococcus deserti (strain DSM 17065 / CIP 109153 / LMG 22923 / VCD115) TaxID=546414 RepID=C1D491_DEIDV|nr:FAD-dependent tricarballylate dehydrogenase TcuA [Deinococcus deserti]ACO47972.1 putative FAD binding protein, putative fumarate reductase flavoprotein subunit [Deinococcus deserti VCD115]